jgi:hypothetical protein
LFLETVSRRARRRAFSFAGIALRVSYHVQPDRWERSVGATIRRKALQIFELLSSNPIHTLVKVGECGPALKCVPRCFGPQQVKRFARARRSMCPPRFTP